jgi:hypothetical protein
LTAILREAWNTSQQAEDRREKIQALSLARDCYSMKLDLLTNATVVDDAIKFVASEKSKDKEGEQVRSSASTSSDSSGNEDDNKEPEESDYDYDYDYDEKSDKVGEDKQEQETGEITTNQVFLLLLPHFDFLSSYLKEVCHLVTVIITSSELSTQDLCWYLTASFPKSIS